jgi:hypothetical protein
VSGLREDEGTADPREQERRKRARREQLFHQCMAEYPPAE